MLERLSEVQAKDLELDALDAERAQVPPALTEKRAEKARLETRLKDRTAERDELRSRVRSAEMELQALGARKKEASEASLRASSAKEAAQYQNQELQFATREQELEEDTLPLMEQLDALNATVEELEAEHARVAPELEELEATERERLAEIDARESALRADRDTQAADVAPALLRQYEQVRRSRRGLGMVEVLEARRCGGCNVQLPIHVIQKARKAAQVVRCPSCGRILWDKEAA